MVQVPYGSIIPSAGAFGYIGTVDPTVEQTSHLLNIIIGYRHPITWGLAGSVANGTYPAFFVPVPVNQTSSLVAVALLTSSGTASCTITDKGITIPSLAGLAASNVPNQVTVTPTPFPIADQDYLGLIVGGSSAVNLTVSLYLQDGI